MIARNFISTLSTFFLKKDYKKKKYLTKSLKGCACDAFSFSNIPALSYITDATRKT